LSVNAPGTVIAGSVFGDEAISVIIKGDCCGKKRLAMTGLGIFGWTLIIIQWEIFFLDCY